MSDQRVPDEELTAQERAWLDAPGDDRGFQPTGPEAGTVSTPPAPPGGRAGASPMPQAEAEPAPAAPPAQPADGSGTSAGDQD
ncbi:hypothetical protein ABZY20_35365 [Streptomyces sp. NPDC006624]|uniref:hypothetical protein n=1 Tax=unclassified Streptomyces TaxID=2593676 RepID=UPI00339F6E5B